MTATGDAINLIKKRLIAIKDETDQLTRALIHLDGQPTRRARKSGKRAATPRKRRQARRGQRPAEVLEFIQRHPDTTATLVAESVGVSAGQVNGIVSSLRKQGKVAKGTPLRATQSSGKRG